MSRLQKSAPGVDIKTHRGGMVHGLLNPAVPFPTLKAKVHILICTLHTYRYIVIIVMGAFGGITILTGVCMQYTQEMLDNSQQACMDLKTATSHLVADQLLRPQGNEIYSRQHSTVSQPIIMYIQAL